MATKTIKRSISMTPEMHDLLMQIVAKRARDVKAIIVVDFAYKGPKRTVRGTGHQALKSTLKYLQYRDQKNNHLAQNHQVERWQDRGMGLHYRDIYKHCCDLQSQHVLAWMWVVSPDPELMALVPKAQQRALLYDLTECVVESYYTERGFEVPEYSYVMHSARTGRGGWRGAARRCCWSAVSRP
jgi:hypothetical protein